MNKHQVRGRAKEAAGAIKQATGHAVGNRRLQGEGLLEKARGKAEASYGDAKEKVKAGWKH